MNGLFGWRAPGINPNEQGFLGALGNKAKGFLGDDPRTGVTGAEKLQVFGAMLKDIGNAGLTNYTGSIGQQVNSAAGQRRAEKQAQVDQRRQQEALEQIARVYDQSNPELAARLRHSYALGGQGAALDSYMQGTDQKRAAEIAGMEARTGDIATDNRLARERLALDREKFGYTQQQDAMDREAAERSLRGLPPETAGTKAFDSQFGKDLVGWMNGGAQKTATNINKLEEVLGTLQSGKNLTGPGIGMVPDRVRPLARETRLDYENVIQESLREILGGQFAQQEARDLIRRSYDEFGDEGANAERVAFMMTLLEQGFAAKDSQAQYFRQNGTLRGWEGEIPSIADMKAAFDAKFPDTEAAGQQGWTQEEEARLEELGRLLGHGR